jgi:hypothetical protein
MTGRILKGKLLTNFNSIGECRVILQLSRAHCTDKKEKKIFLVYKEFRVEQLQRGRAS